MIQYIAKAQSTQLNGPLKYFLITPKGNDTARPQMSHLLTNIINALSRTQSIVANGVANATLNHSNIQITKNVLSSNKHITVANNPAGPAQKNISAVQHHPIKPPMVKVNVIPSYKKMMLKNILGSPHSAVFQQFWKLSNKQREIVNNQVAVIPFSKTLWFDDYPKPDTNLSSVIEILKLKLHKKRCRVNLSMLHRCHHCQIRFTDKDNMTYHKCSSVFAHCQCVPNVFPSHFCRVLNCPVRTEWPTCKSLFLHTFMSHKKFVCVACQKISQVASEIKNGFCRKCLISHGKDGVNTSMLTKDWQKGPLKKIIEDGKEVQARSYNRQTNGNDEIFLVDDSDEESANESHVAESSSKHDDAYYMYDDILSTIQLKDGCINIDIDSGEEQDIEANCDDKNEEMDDIRGEDSKENQPDLIEPIHIVLPDDQRETNAPEPINILGDLQPQFNIARETIAKSDAIKCDDFIEMSKTMAHDLRTNDVGSYKINIQSCDDVKEVQSDSDNDCCIIDAKMKNGK